MVTPFASRNAIDCDRTGASAEIRKSRVGRSDLQRRCFTRAERHRRIRARRFRQSRFRREIHHASNGHFHRHFNRDDIETMDQTIAQRDRRVTVTLAKVSRRILLVIERERLRLVHVSRRRRDHSRNRIVSSVQRGRVDERLED